MGQIFSVKESSSDNDIVLSLSCTVQTNPLFPKRYYVMLPASTPHQRAIDSPSAEPVSERELRLGAPPELRGNHSQDHSHASHRHDQAHSDAHRHHAQNHSQAPHLFQSGARVALSPVLMSVWARIAVAALLSGLLWLAVAWALVNDV